MQAEIRRCDHGLAITASAVITHWSHAQPAANQNVDAALCETCHADIAGASGEHL